MLERLCPVEVPTLTDVGRRGQIQSLQGDVSRLDAEVTGLTLAKSQLATEANDLRQVNAGLATDQRRACHSGR